MKTRLSCVRLAFVGSVFVTLIKTTKNVLPLINHCCFHNRSKKKEFLFLIVDGLGRRETHMKYMFRATIQIRDIHDI